MFYDHIVFPGALADICDDIFYTLNSTNTKGKRTSGVNKNVDVNWYGGGYISSVEEGSYYYFTRANNLNFGYDINSVEAVRLETYSQGGYSSKRKELNHFNQNYLDRKLVGVINLNEGFDPNEFGGKIMLYEGDRKRNYIDDVFYSKRGSIAVFNTFTAYEVEEWKSETPLNYLFCFCVGRKWQ